MDDKNYYYVNIEDENNDVFLAPSWNSVFLYLVSIYCDKVDIERAKRIISHITEISDKVYTFKMFADVNVNFISILEKPFIFENYCIKILDDNGNEVPKTKGMNYL